MLPNNQPSPAPTPCMEDDTSSSEEKLSTRSYCCSRYHYRTPSLSLPVKIEKIKHLKDLNNKNVWSSWYKVANTNIIEPPSVVPATKVDIPTTPATKTAQPLSSPTVTTPATPPTEPVLTKQFVLYQIVKLEANVLAHYAGVKELLEKKMSHHLTELDTFALRFQPTKHSSMLHFKIEMERECQTHLRAGIQDFSNSKHPQKEWIEQMIEKYDAFIGKGNGNCIQKSIQALTHKLSAEVELMVTKLSRKLDQIQFQFEMEYANHEKIMMERETAHTVKNLNTTAHHQLLNLLEMNLPPNVADQVRQTLAIMMTAAQQTYQLSRVGEILRGEVPQLKDYLVDATRSWSKICGANNFQLDSCSQELIVDGFRVIAVLSNAWNNALNHGDTTRMNETKMYFCAAKNDLVEICIINRAQEDATPFDSIEDCESNHKNRNKNEAEAPQHGTTDYYSATEMSKLKFQSSPAAVLTTRMGMTWIKKLCQNRVTLKSEGFGGFTTLTCYMEADHSRLRSQKRSRYNDVDQRGGSIPIDVPSRNNGGLGRVDSSGGNCSSTEQASSNKTKPNNTNVLWDTVFVQQILETHGMVVVEDSKALGLQIQKGLTKSYAINNVRILCGKKATRYQDICQLLDNVVRQKLQQLQQLQQMHHSTAHQHIANPILVVMDRNLGHGLNKEGERVQMPNGDVVAANMRQKGYHGCLVLHTGDSDEQLKMYESHYKKYYIDMVLDKHHLPSYLHICERFSAWVSERFQFGTFMKNTMAAAAGGADVGVLESDICLSASHDLLQANNLLFKMIHSNNEEHNVVLNDLVCTARRLETTMQLLGAPKLRNLCQQICKQFKHGGLLLLFAQQQRQQQEEALEKEKQETQPEMPADVLDVLEPTLIDLFTREVSVMQRLVEIALLLINKTFDEKNLMNESVSVPSVAVHEHRREKSKLQGA